jgi:L-methionine (R)-S-oxide reductase
VPDVHAHPGHIACDARTRSEIVVPLGKHGVLDLDSAGAYVSPSSRLCAQPAAGRRGFDETDRDGLERLVAILLDKASFARVQ